MVRVKLGLVGVLCVLMALAAPAVLSQDDPNPPIEALVGTWAVTIGGTRGALESGEVVKEKLPTDTWQIAIESGNVVRITGFDFGPSSTIYATYDYGLLFLGILDDVTPYVHVGYAQIKGKPGKLSFQGEIISTDASANLSHVDVIKGKQAVASGSAAPGAAPAVGATGDPAPIRASKGAVTPPPIDQLYDTYWIVKVSGKGYNFGQDQAESIKQTLNWHMTQGVEEDSIIVDSDDGGGVDQMDMTYFNGLLIFADGNDTNPATNARTASLKITGNSGAMKIAGNFMDYEIGGSDDYIESDKLSGKQGVGP